MYGSADLDPAVKYYDLAFAAGATADIAWFTKEAHALGSPVLDLCCGTGRLSIEMARIGLLVTAVDSSIGMLSIFRRKLSAEPNDVQSRIEIHQQSMDSFHLNRHFCCVVCCDSFFHNLSPNEERACLVTINRHLDQDGLFLFNIHNNPNPDFLGWASSAEAGKPRKRGKYPLPGDGGTLEVYESLSHDALNQRVDTSLHFRKTGPTGSTIEEADSTWSSRYLCRFEAMYLLELCGFSADAVLGGYQGQSISVSGQLVIKARKRRDV